ncbi:MAG: argininosuccinate synthase [Bacillaceae bacterium]|nr:argininosuccinate synthase [Bacillaceae bacterium]
MMKKKCVLAYSGGLDTSVSIKWIQEKYGYDVIALGLDIGEGKDMESVRQKALKVGAIKAIMLDAKEELAEEYLLPALKGNALYEGKYPLSSALSRPLIAKKLVEVAEKEGAVAVAHGCTGKGNDQVRFEVSIQALNPELEIIAPVREWKMTRDEEIAYAEKHGIDIPVNLDNPFSIDANIWGRACEAGVLENPWLEAPEEAYQWTAPLELTPDEPEYITITFDKGKPIGLNGESLKFVDIIEKLNVIGGKHGIGRIDHVENRLVGIKSREVYENPAALMLIQAHKELEFLTQPREMAKFKPVVEQQMSNMIYEGLWYSPLMNALQSFVEETQQMVSGVVKMKCFKGHAMVVGKQSSNSLYDEDLATYTKGDAFDHDSAVGFIKLWGLPTKVYSQIHNKKPVMTK